MEVSVVLLFMIQAAMTQAADPGSAVATVNGTNITAADVAFAASQQGLTATEPDGTGQKLVERLIDRQLIRNFLATRKIEPLADDLELQIAKAEQAIKKRGEDPKALLTKLGYTPERLKRELGLTLAWQTYVRKTITPDQLKKYFDAHKIELDGTQLRASQIFLKLPKPAREMDVAEKVARLSEIRQSILDQKLSFADAARKYSESPSREQGGDIGVFGWSGKLPPAVSHAAFAMKVEELSDPVVSPLGVHLIQVTERHPGDFSLEDVRSVILDRISQQMWAETVQKERSMAKIEIHSGSGKN